MWTTTTHDTPRLSVPPPGRVRTADAVDMAALLAPALGAPCAAADGRAACRVPPPATTCKAPYGATRAARRCSLAAARCAPERAVTVRSAGAPRVLARSPVRRRCLHPWPRLTRGCAVSARRARRGARVVAAAGSSSETVELPIFPLGLVATPGAEGAHVALARTLAARARPPGASRTRLPAAFACAARGATTARSHKRARCAPLRRVGAPPRFARRRTASTSGAIPARNPTTLGACGTQHACRVACCGCSRGRGLVSRSAAEHL